MKLSKLAELGTAHRGDPSLEYPGTYYVYVNGRETDSIVEGVDDPYSAKDIAYSLAKGKEVDGEVSICWEASDNDPRVGQVWFTGFFQLEKWGKKPFHYEGAGW